MTITAVAGAGLLALSGCGAPNINTDPEKYGAWAIEAVSKQDADGQRQFLEDNLVMGSPGREDDGSLYEDAVEDLYFDEELVTGEAPRCKAGRVMRSEEQDGMHAFGFEVECKGAPGITAAAAMLMPDEETGEYGLGMVSFGTLEDLAE